MKSYSFRLGVYDGDKEVCQAPLSYEEMMLIISGYPDSPSNEKLFELAAHHPSSLVREYVATKDNLSSKTVDILCSDKSINVLRSLVRSLAFKKYVGEKLLLSFIKLDIELAKNIAESYEQFEMADQSKLIAALLESDDPAVLNSLASNYLTPKKIIKELANYQDPYVANTAKERLKN